MSSIPSVTEAARLRVLRAAEERRRIREEEDARAEQEVREALESLEKEEAAERERARLETERLAALEAQQSAIRVGKRKAAVLDESVGGPGSRVRPFFLSSWLI